MNIVCQNRKARFEYDVIDKLEVGIVLFGTEVKSLRNNNASLDGSYAIFDEGQITLIGCHIEPYSHGNVHNHNPKRNRKLLLHKREIKKFAEKAKIKGYTLVPLSLYFNKGKAKIELALCKGRQLHDKREAIKKRDALREME